MADAATLPSIAEHGASCLPAVEVDSYNIEIKDGGGNVIFKGEIVTGVKTATYKVPALQPGQYPYLCTVHPTMTGTATVQ